MVKLEFIFPPEVTLPLLDLERAFHAGTQRHASHGGRGGINGQGAVQSLEDHREGAAAELALSTYLGLQWTGQTGMRRPDVGRGLEVRQTKYQTGKMIYRNKGAEDHRLPYFLACGEKGTYTFPGWLFGFEVLALGMFDNFGNKRPAVNVAPQERLRPVWDETWRPWA